MMLVHGILINKRIASHYCIAKKMALGFGYKGNRRETLKDLGVRPPILQITLAGSFL
jgi:hypothetical protein